MYIQPAAKYIHVSTPTLSPPLHLDLFSLMTRPDHHDLHFHHCKLFSCTVCEQHSIYTACEHGRPSLWMRPYTFCDNTDDWVSGVISLHTYSNCSCLDNRSHVPASFSWANYLDVQLAWLIIIMLQLLKFTFLSLSLCVWKREKESEKEGERIQDITNSTFTRTFSLFIVCWQLLVCWLQNLGAHFAPSVGL